MIALDIFKVLGYVLRNDKLLGFLITINTISSIKNSVSGYGEGIERLKGAGLGQLLREDSRASGNVTIRKDISGLDYSTFVSKDCFKNLVKLKLVKNYEYLPETDSIRQFGNNYIDLKRRGFDYSQAKINELETCYTYSDIKSIGRGYTCGNITAMRSVTRDNAIVDLKLIGNIDTNLKELLDKYKYEFKAYSRMDLDRVDIIASLNHLKEVGVFGGSLRINYLGLNRMYSCINLLRRSRIYNTIEYGIGRDKQFEIVRAVIEDASNKNIERLFLNVDDCDKIYSLNDMKLAYKKAINNELCASYSFNDWLEDVLNSLEYMEITE